MTGKDDIIAAAAEWIASQPPGVTVPAIRTQFQLSAREACGAMAAAAPLRRLNDEVSS